MGDRTTKNGPEKPSLRAHYLHQWMRPKLLYQRASKSNEEMSWNRLERKTQRNGLFKHVIVEKLLILIVPKKELFKSVVLGKLHVMTYRITSIRNRYALSQPTKHNSVAVIELHNLITRADKPVLADWKSPKARQVDG